MWAPRNWPRCSACREPLLILSIGGELVCPRGHLQSVRLYHKRQDPAPEPRIVRRLTIEQRAVEENVT